MWKNIRGSCEDSIFASTMGLASTAQFFAINKKKPKWEWCQCEAVQHPLYSEFQGFRS
jgi:hypothetical protein